MKITIFGANGKVGSKVVAALLAAGHEVTAFIHGPSRLADHPSLHLIQGDIHSRADVEKALNTAEVVISTLGSWGTKSKDILSVGMEHIVPSMQQAGIKRIISLTGAGALDSTDKLRWFDTLNHFALSIVAPAILKDGEKHIATLRASNLDWTVIRSPIMRETGRRGYKLTISAPLPWATISRWDVVDAIVQQVTDYDPMSHSPFIVRSR